MKSFFMFIIGILVGASGMYYVFQNSLQENMETLLNSTFEAVQENISQQANKINGQVAKQVGTDVSTTGGNSNLNVDKDMINKLIESQKKEIIKILEEQKQKIKSQLEGSIKEYLTKKVSEIFGDK